MNITKLKKPFVLTVLFFLPVLFLLFLYPSKHNYKTLDILKKDLPELTNFVDKNGDDLRLESHLTVLGFLGETPMDDAILALNLKELVYDKFRGFKRFQIVVLVPESAKAQVALLEKELNQYEFLEYWKFGFGSKEDVLAAYQELKISAVLDASLKTSDVFIIDKERNQRGRLDDRDKNEIKRNSPIFGLSSYDCLEVSVLKNKMSEDVRILFTEYRQKRKGNFNSTSRRADDLKGDEKN
ncbi:MAG: hypothetical protein QMC27_01050 [Flavobacteriaceae bacterium]|jgi:hypothetical protein|tara:strand:- start:185 stop:904 length:720 start_codon:yes stop_codon:yes gene_type:complete